VLVSIACVGEYNMCVGEYNVWCLVECVGEYNMCW
jgi:hypothetical protein